MLNQGLQLLLYGMGAVFIFLSLLVLCAGLMSRCISRYLPETATAEPARLDSNPPPEQLVAVIAAAIKQHRHRKNR